MHALEMSNSAGEVIDRAFHPATRRDTLVILGHGVTGNKDRPLLVAIAEGLAARGWPCLRISFSGNGESGGRFEDSCITKEVEDLKSVLSAVPDYVRVVYAGHSMGAAVGVLTAEDDLRIRVLVSLAGMTHTAEFVRREFGDVTPGQGNMWDDEDCPLSKTYVSDLSMIGNTLHSAARVTQPWLLIHGTEDDVVPIGDGRDAHAAAVCEKRWVEIAGAGHSFDETSYPAIIEAMDGWLSVHLGKA
jgi:pimeloyl-ACP methyl ester carboxylesterase